MCKLNAVDPRGLKAPGFIQTPLLTLENSNPGFKTCLSNVNPRRRRYTKGKAIEAKERAVRWGAAR